MKVDILGDERVSGTLAVVLGALLLCFCSCSRRVVYVPVESERVVAAHDTLREVALRVDSVVIKDSVAVVTRGDTVFMTRWRERVRTRERVDTVYRAVTDTVKFTRSVPYPVERELSRWERMRMNVGGVAIWVLLAALAAGTVWVIFSKLVRLRR